MVLVSRSYIVGVYHELEYGGYEDTVMCPRLGSRTPINAPWTLGTSIDGNGQMILAAKWPGPLGHRGPGPN